jgi:hypothetical protein
MRFHFLGAASLAATLIAGAAHAAPAVTGDYVESRSANVYVGACHHEGELLTAGQNAVMAWNIGEGEYAGVDLKGVRVLAVVSGDKNLCFDDAKRQSALYVSDSATPAQREAVVAMLKERAAKALGELLSVKTVPLEFDASGQTYRVQAAGVAFMKIKKETGELCCKQPYKLWDKPFVSVKDAKAGYCLGVEFKDATLLKTWKASDQNNAYFGQFSL